MNVDIENDPIKPSKCRFCEMSIIVIGTERDVDISATNGEQLVLELCPKFS